MPAASSPPPTPPAPPQLLPGGEARSASHLRDLVELGGANIPGEDSVGGFGVSNFGLSSFSDTDGDGIPDGCDACPGFPDGQDSDADGVPDGCDICPGFDDAVDTDADTVPDTCLIPVANALDFGKTSPLVYSELTSDNPIDLTRYQVACCYMGRVGLINSGGASSGEGDLEQAVRTAVINKRAGGLGLISGRKAFQRPTSDGVELLNAIQDVYLCEDVTVA